MKRILILLTCLSAHSLSADRVERVDGAEMSVDLLWWNARGDEMIYAITREGSHVESPDSILDDLNSKSHLVTPQSSPGFRLHFDKDLFCNDVRVIGEYTWYKTNDSRSVNLNAPNDPESYVQMSSDFLYGQEVLTFSQILDGTLESKFYFSMNRFDVGLEKVFCFCERWRFAPFVTGTYLHTDENITVKADTTLLQGVVVEQQNKVDTTYDGFGGQLGFWVDWNFFRNFSIYAGASLTGTYGKFSGKSHFRYHSNQFGSSLLKDHFKLNYWTGRIVSDVKILLNYTTCLCTKYDLRMYIGWELQSLFDQTNWINRAGLAGRNSDQPSANLTLQGLVLGAELAF